MGGDKHKALVAIASSYEHWLDLVDGLKHPGVCPLCRYGKTMLFQSTNGEDACSFCPVKIYTGAECVDDPDFVEYVKEVVYSKSSPQHARHYGRRVQDELISLWLETLGDDEFTTTMEDRRER